MIKSKFITFATEDIYLSNLDNIPDHSVVFIEDTQLIYHKGKAYTLNKSDTDKLSKLVSDGNGSIRITDSGLLYKLNDLDIHVSRPIYLDEKLILDTNTDKPFRIKGDGLLSIVATTEIGGGYTGELVFKVPNVKTTQSAVHDPDVAGDSLSFISNIRLDSNGCIYVSKKSVSPMLGATVDSAGESGLVPKPLSTDCDKYLRGDGTWSSIEDTINYSPFTISLSNEWSPSGFILNEETGFTNGVYVIKILSGGLMFSGTVSVYVGNITVEDEIVLHMSGIALVFLDGTLGRIYAKIAPSLSADYGELYLATNVPQTAITNLSITMKKIL